MTMENESESTCDIYSKQNITDKVLYAVMDSLSPKRNVELEQDLVKDLEVDSLETIELALVLEEEFNRNLGLDKDFQEGRIKTVQNLVDVIDARLHNKENPLLIAHQKNKGMFGRIFGRQNGD